jgi:hypothetical protein
LFHQPHLVGCVQQYSQNPQGLKSQVWWLHDAQVSHVVLTAPFRLCLATISDQMSSFFLTCPPPILHSIVGLLRMAESQRGKDCRGEGRRVGQPVLQQQVWDWTTMWNGREADRMLQDRVWRSTESWQILLARAGYTREAIQIWDGLEEIEHKTPPRTLQLAFDPTHTKWNWPEPSSHFFVAPNRGTSPGDSYHSLAVGSW